MRWGGGINVGHSAEQELEHYARCQSPAPKPLSSSCLGAGNRVVIGLNAYGDRDAGFQ